MVTNELVLREEILKTTHRWPIILFFCLAGALIGWTFSFLWPTTFRASKEIYVAINPYRALTDKNTADYAGVQFNNPDDYKNWQMANLDALVNSNWMIAATLERLREADDFWLGIDASEFSHMSKVNWRNAGKWQLVVESSDINRSSQAVTAWHDVIIEQIQSAVSEAQNILVLDKQLQSNSALITSLTFRVGELEQIQKLLESERSFFSAQNSSYSVDEIKRESILKILSPFNSQAKLMVSLNSFPPQDSTAGEIKEWLEKNIQTIGYELQVNNNQIIFLQQKNDEIAAEYKNSSEKSFGLSGNLLVDSLNNQSSDKYPVRPQGALILIGALLGLLLWIILWLTGITLRTG